MTGIGRYLRSDMRRVRGWLNTLTAEVIAALGQHQTALGLSGAVGEIGVHHGKFWLVLDHIAAPDELRFAIDTFGLQDLNTDRSGRGDLNRFERNRKRFGAKEGRVEIITASSLDVTAEQLAARVGKVRLFSIDGGHTSHCVVNDLGLADAVLSRDGLVALDDVFNEHWPGVMTGFAQFMQTGRGGLVPFCIVPGKVLLSTPATADRYGQFVRERFASHVIRTHDFYGRNVPILVHPAGFTLRVRAAVEGTPLEPMARRFYHRFLR